MESTQSVHGRITYRRVERVITAKIHDLDRVQLKNADIPELCRTLQYAIDTLQDVRTELRWREATKTWPSPL